MFRKKMYDLARSLPALERYNLVSQIIRAATSLTNNIAEGYGRYQFQESIQFFRIARGSLEELVDDIKICLDEQYLAERGLQDLLDDARRIHQLINGYIRYLKATKESL